MQIMNNIIKQLAEHMCLSYRSIGFHTASIQQDKVRINTSWLQMSKVFLMVFWNSSSMLSGYVLGKSWGCLSFNSYRIVRYFRLRFVEVKVMMTYLLLIFKWLITIIGWRWNHVEFVQNTLSENPISPLPSKNYKEPYDLWRPVILHKRKFLLCQEKITSGIRKIPVSIEVP